jgi:hypothetical protein
MGLIDNQASWLKVCQTGGVLPPDRLHARDNHVVRLLQSPLRALDLHRHGRVLLGDSASCLLQQLASMGEHERLLPVLPLKFADQGAKKGGLPGAGRHHHEHTIEPLILTGKDLSQSLGLVRTQHHARGVERSFHATGTA